MRMLLELLCASVIGFGPSPSGAAQPAVKAEECSVIEGKVRTHLKLRAAATIGAAEFARVTELHLRGEPITDAGAAWLAATGLQGLTTLDLGDTKVMKQ